MVAQMVKRLPETQETQVWSLGREDLLEKEMATYSSILTWEIPWTEEPGGLQSMGLQRVGHDWGTSLSFFLSHQGSPIQTNLQVVPSCSWGTWGPPGVDGRYGCHPFSGSPLLSKYLGREAALSTFLSPSLRYLFSTLRPLCSGFWSLFYTSLSQLWVTGQMGLGHPRPGILLWGHPHGLCMFFGPVQCLFSGPAASPGWWLPGA